MPEPSMLNRPSASGGHTAFVVMLDEAETAVAGLMAQRAGVSVQQIVQGLATSGPFRDAAACHAYQPNPTEPENDWNRPNHADRQRDNLVTLLLEMIGMRPV